MPIRSSMLLITDINDTPLFDQPSGLTLGSFDGVHLGHQALLKHLRAQLPSNGMLAVFTFFNHPSHIFSPQSPISLICPPLQKVKHLKDYGADIVLLLPFTREFAKTSFEEFIKLLKQRLNFSSLVLGAGATFGKNKEGNEDNVKLLAGELGFQVDYLQKYLVNGTPVSSGRIRTLISQGNFLEIQQCLGRPYSLMGCLLKENDQYQLHLPGICLPPKGTYPIHLKTSAQTYQGKAHIIQKEHKVLLDIPEKRLPLQGKDAELVFQF